MEHSFRLDGFCYVAKNGDDTSSTIATDNPQCVDPSNTATFVPLRTIQKGMEVCHNQQTIIVGSGMYTETLVINLTGKTVWLEADGNVVIAGTEANEFRVIGTSVYRGFTFTNFTDNFLTTLGYYYDCKFVNLNFADQYNGYLDFYEGSQLINCNITGGRRFKIVDSIVWGGDLKKVKTLVSSYVSPGCRVQMYTSWDEGTTPPGNNYNNIQGEIAVALLNDNPDEAVYYDFDGHRAAFPDFNVNSISQEPKFNYPEAGDFTLQTDSPHIGAATESNNIGGTNVSKSGFVGLPQPHLEDIGPWVERDVDLLSNNYAVKTGFSSGYLELKPIKLADFPVPVQKLNYFGNLAFNSYSTDGAADKRNVPDSVTGDTSVKAGTPDRLSVQIRWTTGSVEPLSPLNFDNQGIKPLGEWTDIEINQKPMVDGAGNGNGHPDYTPASGQGIAATWIQVRVTLRNDYTTVVQPPAQ